ncbi:MAG: 4Fe-4S dicluster domain-containing protein [Thiohalomonadaceae bacterium]
MAMTILAEECTSCGDCLPVCPTGALMKKKGSFVIDPAVCTECEGEFDEPQCVEACPIDGCILPLEA